MDKPRKKNGEILQKLRQNRDVFESNRTRTSMRLAARIIKGIKDKKWSKGEFAEKINKKASVITRWLSGTHNFTSDTLSDIEQILDIDLFRLDHNEINAISSARASGNLTVNVFILADRYSTQPENAALYSYANIDGIQTMDTVFENEN